MKIIFSPCKEMIFDNQVNKKTDFSENTKKIINELKKLSSEELKEIFKISDNVANEVSIYIKDFEKQESFKAIDMYNGLSFRYLKENGLNENERKYLEEHLLILSALYGPIGPEKLIRPYRLDFNTKLKVDGKTLKSFWKEEFNRHFEKGEVILNLASNEFSNLLNRSDFKVYDFEFYEEVDKKIKSHSTISKKGRGLMLKYLCKNKILDVDKVKNFNLDGYKYEEKLSEDEKFSFVRPGN